MKLEFFASLRQFCAFNISTKQSLAFSQMILQFFCRFLNFTLFSRAHAFLFYKWESMFVGCSFGANLYQFAPFFWTIQLSSSNPWRPSHFDTHMSKSGQDARGKLSDAVQWYSGASFSLYLRALFGTMQGNPRQVLFEVFQTTVKLELELCVCRCVCEQTSEKAANCGTIQCPWHICLDVGAGRSQMGLIM